MVRSDPEGRTFINTGFWIKMHNIDFKYSGSGELLTYSKIDLVKNKKDKSMSLVSIVLNAWKGHNQSSYVEFP